MYTYPEEQCLTVIQGEKKFFDNFIDFYIKCLMIEEGWIGGFSWDADSYFDKHQVILQPYPDEWALSWLSLEKVGEQKTIELPTQEFKAAWVCHPGGLEDHIIIELERQYVAMLWFTTA